MNNKYIGYYESPIGTIEIITSDDYLLSISFVEKNEEICDGPIILKQVIKQIDEYFKGNRTNFDIPIKLEGTEFQKKVWKALLEIPYGEKISYKEIAKKVGNEKASRAVGMANNKNKLGIIIPCHRVIGTNKKLVGYAGGLVKKEWLLNHELKYKKA